MKQNDVSQLMSLLSDVPEDTNLDDLFQELLAAFDGPRGYALHCRSVFDNAPPGGQAQQRILDQVAMLASRKASLEKNTKTDFGSVSNEDLEAMFQSRVKEVTSDPTQTSHPQSGGANQPHEATTEEVQAGESTGPAESE